jgi:methanol metabolism-related c-type cytochrome
MTLRGIAIAAMLAAGGGGIALAQGPGDPTSVENVGGKHLDAEGIPTFNIEEDGTVDWYTYSGFRRYHAECHTCHGPDGMGSSYAPALVETVQNMSYFDFLGIVGGGRQAVGGGQQSVMPAFSTNPNVMCYIDDIYIYLRARAQGDLPRGRPGERAEKSEAYAEQEDACMGTPG